MVRVLHLSSGNLFGGVETFLIALARARNLSPRMQLEFGLCFQGRLADELRAAGAAVHFLGNVRTSRPLSVWRARRRLTQLLGQRPGFDVVACHMPWTQAIFAATVHRARLPLVFWFHNEANGRHWIDWWARHTALPDLTICNSAYTAATLPPSFSAVPAQILYYPVPEPQLAFDAGARAALRAELDTADEAAVIIQVSRMEPWKGHQIHLTALGQLRELAGWVCWMVGGAQRPEEAAYLNSLKAQAERLGIGPRLRFLGERHDVARLLRAADIFCQPNQKPEPFGLVFIEALFARLPVVAIASGGAAEIVDPSVGFATAADADAVAAAERLLIEQPGLRRALGAAGPARARALCDVTTQLDKLSQMFCALAGESRSPA